MITWRKKSSKLNKNAEQCTIHDRIEEIKGKITLKKRDHKAYFTQARQSIKDNDVLIKNLRNEIKEKLVLQRRYLYADSHIIREGFSKNQESRLAMQRYSVDKAKFEKDEQIFGLIGRLNRCLYLRRSKIQQIANLSETLHEMKLASIPEDDLLYRRKIQFLSTTLDKMKLKCTSARFIQKTYKQILRHLEKDNLSLPGRLKKLEMQVQRANKEVNNELIPVQKHAKHAYDSTKFEKERLETKLLKGKKARDAVLVSTRKVFKQLSQAIQDKEVKPKKRIIPRLEFEESSSASVCTDKGKRLWNKARKFVMLKVALDKLQEKMCVNHPYEITGCIKSQMRRSLELGHCVKELQEQKEALIKIRDKVQKDLDVIKDNHQTLLDDTKLKVEKYEKKQEGISRHCGVVLAKFNKNKVIVHQVNGSVEHIAHKISSCVWLAEEVRDKIGTDYKLTKLVQTDKLNIPSPKHDSVKALLLCGDKLKLLHIGLRSLYSDQKDHEMLLAVSEKERNQDTLAAVRSNAPANTRLIILEDEEVPQHDDFLCNDDDENNEYLSREDIKSALKELTESQSVRRKNKRPKT